MTAWSPGSAAVWGLLVVLGVGTLGLRVSFLVARSVVDRLPGSVERALGFVPVAVLTALIFPAVFVFDGSLAGAVLDARVLAAAVATVVAWRTENMLATILAGMGALWLVALVT